MHFLVRRPYQIPAGRSAGIDQAFEFQAGDNVWKFPVSEFGQGRRVVDVHSGGYNNGSHIQGQDLILLGIIHALPLTSLETFVAGYDTVFV